MVFVLLPMRNSHNTIRISLGVVLDIVTCISLKYRVVDRHNVHRLVLGLLSHIGIARGGHGSAFALLSLNVALSSKTSYLNCT